jgi:3-carboxy-cis,cis-muconate cycloisomerase
MFDSALFRDVFTTPAMRAIFSDDAQLAAFVKAEVALAIAQGVLDALLKRPTVASALPRDQLAALCKPANYLGTAGGDG